jgi:Ca-activated chloride channel family protein
MERAPRRRAKGRAAWLACAPFLLVLCGLMMPLDAQSPFRASVDLVQVWVTVTDANGRLVAGLSRDDFEVSEGGVPQPITHFGTERVPVSLGLLVDASDSMRGQKIAEANASIGRFLGELLDAGDEVFVSSFNHAPHVLANWTTPPARLRGVLTDVRPSGGTALYDALMTFAPVFAKRGHVRTALLVISDGADTASDAVLRDVREELRKTDASVYAIAIDAPDARPSSRVNPQTLREITGPSGGYTEVVRSPSELGSATQRIAEELNQQYAIAYLSPPPIDGSWRSIRVRTRGEQYTTRARRGYYAVRQTR